MAFLAKIRRGCTGTRHFGVFALAFANNSLKNEAKAVNLDDNSRLFNLKGMEGNVKGRLRGPTSHLVLSRFTYTFWGISRATQSDIAY